MFDSRGAFQMWHKHSGFKFYASSLIKTLTQQKDNETIERQQCKDDNFVERDSKGFQETEESTNQVEIDIHALAFIILNQSFPFMTSHLIFQEASSNQLMRLAKNIPQQYNVLELRYNLLLSLCTVIVTFSLTNTTLSKLN